MTLVDSIDSILMLYSYSGFPERSWAIFERVASTEDQGDKPNMPKLEAEIPNRAELPHLSTGGDTPPPIHVSETNEVQTETRKPKPTEYDTFEAVEQDTKLKSDFEVNVTVKEDRVTRNLVVKRNTMSGLSIILTLMSIVVAFR
jgi:nickel/cobalt transporter (NiCoT) family protein